MKTKRIKIDDGEQVELHLRKPGAKKLKASMTMIGPASITIVHSKLAKKQKPKTLKNLPGRLTC